MFTRKKEVNRLCKGKMVKFSLFTPSWFIGRVEGIAPPILNLGCRWNWVASITPRPLYSWEINAVPIEWEAVWAPDLVWTTLQSEIRPVGFQTLDHPVFSVYSTEKKNPLAVSYAVNNYLGDYFWHGVVIRKLRTPLHAYLEGTKKQNSIQ